MNHTADHESRRQRGIAAYAAIFAVPDQQVPAAMAARVGTAFADEALQAAGGSAWASPALTGAGPQYRHPHRPDRARCVRRSPQRSPSARPPARPRSGSADRPMTLLAVYIGYARASLAMETVQGLFGSDDQATVPEKLTPAQ